MSETKVVLSFTESELELLIECMNIIPHFHETEESLKLLQKLDQANTGLKRSR